MRGNAFALFSLAVICLVLLGCKPQRPKDVLSERTMENIMVDYHLAQGMAELAESDAEAVRYKYTQAVFKKHHVTEAEFDTSLVYYFENAEKFSEIYKNVCLRIEAQAEKYGVDAQASQNQYRHLTNQGDTANIWSDRSYAAVIPNRIQNLYHFAITADTTFRKGDSFIWHFHTQYITQGLDREAYAVFTLHYDNDTIVSVTQHIRGNRNFELNYAPVSPLDTLALRRMDGYVFMPTLSEKEQELQVLLLQDLSMIRMHAQPKDTLDTSLQDSTQLDSLSADSLLPSIPKRRLSPTELKESQPHERKINVQKEKPLRNNRRNNNSQPLRRRYQL